MDSSVKCNTAIEADVDVLAKLCEEGFERGSELEAFAGCEVEGHGDRPDTPSGGLQFGDLVPFPAADAGQSTNSFIFVSPTMEDCFTKR